MQRSRRGHVTVLDDTELGGAAADVDVEDAFTLLVRQLRRTRAVGRQHRLHVVPGGGGDEIAALLRQQGGDRLGILAAQRLAGEDDHAGVDILWLDARRRIGLVDDGAERGVVDALIARIRRQRHRRLEQGLPRYDVVAAGEVLAIAAQVNAGEDHLRARRTDVDADRHQRHMVLDPDRVLFQPLVAVELEMIVVVIGVAVVLVHDVLAEQVIGDRMAAFAILGHSSLLLAAPQRSHGPRARPRYRTAHLRWSKRKPLEIARRRNRGPRAHEGNVPARASLTEPGRAVTLRAAIPPPDGCDRDRHQDPQAAESYIARLGARGIEYVFANAGTDFAPIIEALSRAKDAKIPRFMTVPHENVAMAMAHGYYRIAGKPAAVMVHVTVGTANAINGLINAARDNVPLLLAAGRTPLTETGSIASRNRPIHWD